MLHHLARPAVMAPLRQCANEGEKLVNRPSQQPNGPQTGADVLALLVHRSPDYQEIKGPHFADSRLDWHLIEIQCEAD